MTAGPANQRTAAVCLPILTPEDKNYIFVGTEDRLVNMGGWPPYLLGSPDRPAVCVGVCRGTTVNLHLCASDLELVGCFIQLGV